MLMSSSARTIGNRSVRVLSTHPLDPVDRARFEQDPSDIPLAESKKES